MERFEMARQGLVVNNTAGPFCFYADAQATIAALQACIGTIRGLLGVQPVRNVDDCTLEQHTKEIVGHVESQLTQRTAELEAANKLLYRKNCALGRAETIINDLQAELERVRALIKALPKVEGAVVVSNGYVKDSTRCHALFGADEDAALYAALLQHRQGMEG